MGKGLIDPNGARKVVVADHLYFGKSHTENVGNTSESLEEVLGEAWNLKIGGILIVNTGPTDLRYQTDGTAASGSAGGTLESGASQTFPGNKDHLDDMRLFRQASSAVSFDQLVSIRGE